MTPPVSELEWKPCWRIIPSRFPPIHLFERVTDPADLDAIIALESLTNPRLRDEIGAISMVIEQDRISGPGSSVIMAAFTHLNPEGSRFSDGSFGVYYAAADLDTAIAETTFHREKFMRATGEPRMELDMRVYVADLRGPLHDVRKGESDFPFVYDKEEYAPSQALGKKLRANGSYGVAYDSVRKDKGECVAVFRPPVLSAARQERHLCYRWDGSRIDLVYEKRLMG